MINWLKTVYIWQFIWQFSQEIYSTLLTALCSFFSLSISAFVYVSFSSSSSSGTAPTRGSPGLQNQTTSTGRPGFHGDSTTGAPGLHTTRSQGGVPGVASPGVTGQPGLQKTTTSSTGIIGCWSNLPFTRYCWVFIRKLNFFLFLCNALLINSVFVLNDQTGGPPDHLSIKGSPQVNLDCISPHPSILEDLGCKPQKVRETAALLVILRSDRTHGLRLYCNLYFLIEFTAPWTATTPLDDGQPRVLCVEGQFSCRSFGCVHSAQVCDGRQDCLDGSDEEHCGMHHQPVWGQTSGSTEEWH